MSEFTHLHLHTQYSILDGAASIPVLMAKAKKDGMKAMAITDHGNMFGVVTFMRQAKKNGIKPIIGCEMYVAHNSMQDKKGKEDRSGYHLILLAKNKKGYHNLAKLVTLAYKDGFYYTPRIDKELLKKYSEGLIASTACLGGEVPKSIMRNGTEQASKIIEEYLQIFGDDFYLELMRHGLEDQDIVNKALIELAQKHEVKIIATNDVHYVNKEDFEAHHILVCLNTGKDADDKDGMKYSGHEYFKTTEEMKLLFSDIPEALENIDEIVNKIEDFEVERKVILPEYPLPPAYSDADEYLNHLTFQGAEKRYEEITDSIAERLNFELKVVKDMGFAGYFLIVQDFINKAREMDVIVGPGRGSAAGSAVAYCIGITNIDPIHYNLLFERFLNPERVTMPDMDIDFDDYGREKVINYVVDKYGENRVAQIITFGSMAARSSIRDVARVLKLPLNTADRLAKLVPADPGMTLKKAFAQVKELKKDKDSGEPLVQKTLKYAEILEGSARHTGTHACGVIIGKDDLFEHIPLSTAKDSKLMVTQYEGELVESVGMLKMDFLGLKTLTIIKDALENIKGSKNIDINIDEIPIDDDKTYELFRNGFTYGIFQFESEGMRSHLKNLKPNNIEDLIAMNALYRPGPMEYIPDFVKRKNGLVKVDYPHAMLEEVLKPTYGIMVYQEQIMKCAQIIGGFSLGKADILRRAMGKKKKDAMQDMKVEFVEGAAKNNIDKEKAEYIFHMMEAFANYGFNRSHAAAYSIVAYQTAYLKTHHPASFMAATLAHNMDDMAKINLYITESNKMGIEVLGPDINDSQYKFTVNKERIIRFGLGAIKGVGEAAVEAILSERNEKGPYSDIFDFTCRVNLRAVNKKCIESLAMAGAFDSFEGIHRAQYFHMEENEDQTAIDKAIKFGNRVKESKKSHQISLFGDMEDAHIAKPNLPEVEPWASIKILQEEKRLIGFYVSGHPLDEFKFEIDHFTSTSIDNFNDNYPSFYNKTFKIAGLITEFTERFTKGGDTYGMFTIEDFTNSMKFFLFREKYLKFKHFLEPGTKVFLSGLVRPRYRDAVDYTSDITEINLLSGYRTKALKKITIKIPLEILDKELSKK
ncbi:MAG: DNA polymerase III subunit alpha, partial [Bacteroidetes bacterium]|nr:DNA polymerase III subunit alpha [Bacteroidota bacterium]